MTALRPGRSGETVLTQAEDGVLTVRLNRAESAHARNQVMRDELASLWRAVAADREVRVVVLTGAGDRYLCAGMDLREASQPEEPVARRDRMQRSRDIELLADLPQPTVAAINGYALGGGLEMALACDMRLIADSAQVGFPEVPRGLVPGGGGTQRLPRAATAQRRASNPVSTALVMSHLSTYLLPRGPAVPAVSGKLVQLRGTYDVCLMREHRFGQQ